MFRKVFLVIFFLGIAFAWISPHTVALAGSCDYPNFCDTRPRPASDTNAPKPGSPCVIPGVTDNATYQYSKGDCPWWDAGGTCNVTCGFLYSGYCCEPVGKPAPPANTVPTPPCAQYTKPGGQCETVSTAIGNIHTDVASLVQNLFSILLGLAGGVAILLIIVAGYQLIASQGNPEKVKEGRERLTSAIVGLLFIIFSVVILQIIGVDILHLPGFAH